MKESPSSPLTQQEKQTGELIPAIEELREPIKKILGQLRPHLEKGEYQILISDEISGRIPALLFLHIINEIYKQKGFPPLTFIPMAGGYPKFPDKKNPEIRDALRDEAMEYMFNEKPEDIKWKIKRIIPKTRHKDTKELKALIITDALWEGKTFEVFNLGLIQSGIKSDTASIGIDGKMKDYAWRKILEDMYKSTIFWGMEGTPMITHMKELSGVEKINPFITRTRASRDPIVIQERKKARKNEKILAQELLAWYLTQEPKNPQ